MAQRKRRKSDWQRENAAGRPSLTRSSQSGRKTGAGDALDAASASSRAEAPDRKLFINRELSLLDFNRRVLEQAADESVPLLERLRFLTISSSNLDEFFEIRVANIKEQAAAGVQSLGPEDVRPEDLVHLIHEKARELVTEQYRVFNDLLLPALADKGVRILRRTEWSQAVNDWVGDWFNREVQPLLTPVGLDPAHPFPNVLNRILNFFVQLEGKDAFSRNIGVAIVQTPRLLPRVLKLPPAVSGGAQDFVLLSAAIHANIGTLFPSMEVKGCWQFRVTRNSDLWLDEEEVEDLAEALRYELPHRNYGDAVRLEVADNCPPEVASRLLDHFNLTPDDLYRVNGPVNLNRLVLLYNLADLPELKYPPHTPSLPPRIGKADELYETLRKGDVLLHHPYQSFSPVLDFIQRASVDPAVVAVMVTLYRTGDRSQITDALFNAARAGKEVTAVIELRARFDEAANINLAQHLQSAGVQVMYGVVGYKTHAKMMLVLRREEGGLRRYVHLGTGNYHTTTARFYTDIGLLTTNEEICTDVHRLFRELMAPGEAPTMKHLHYSPFTLNTMVIERIHEQAELARLGKPSRIRAKMNALADPGVIQALYAASQAGVPIDLVVRGVCCLRPGVPGVSENIRVISIVGRWLEHSRVYSFGPSGEHTYASSADWMQRNLHRRVESCFPILDPALKARVVEECLDLPLADNCQAWELKPDGKWYRRGPGSEPRRAAQEVLIARYNQVGPAA
ncbi:MAG: polyphosphate kinase 1 [Planctomycetes bacterium]|nr:polyphosphate kinase 1 [Planctomycetota bacterium]MCW8134760.1 polyphosphate kinase 1 [Planctomycetota bacterium]